MIKNKNRILLLDALRGFCVFCMIFFHAFLIFYYAFDIAWSESLFLFFKPFQPLFAGLFILISGICSRFSHDNFSRGFKLFLVAMALSFVTICVLPATGIYDAEVYFGILHLLSCSMLLFWALQKPVDRLKPSWGMVLSLLGFILTYNIINGELGFNAFAFKIPEKISQVRWLFPFGIMYDGFYSADYFPLLPWFFIFLFGAFLGVYIRSGHMPKWTYEAHAKLFIFLGQKALIVYLIHFPIIYIVGYIVSLI